MCNDVLVFYFVLTWVIMDFGFILILHDLDEIKEHLKAIENETETA